MPVINRTIEVSEKQRQFMEANAVFRCFVGGIGSGKSYIGALDMIRRSKPNRLYLVTAPTYPMLSDATFRSVVGLAQKLGVVNPGDAKTSPPPSVKLRNGAEILFRSTDNPGTLRGPNLTGIWMDEASLSRQEAFDILIGRLREDSDQGWLTATFTPKGKLHWTYKTFATNQPDTALIHATSDENPFLPAGFVNRLKTKYTAQQTKQELGGQFVDGGGNHYHPEMWPRYVDMGDAYKIRDGQRWRHVLKTNCSTMLALDWAMGKPKNDAKSKQMAALGTDDTRGDCTAFVVADMDNDRGDLFFRWCLNERIPMGSNAPRLAEACRRFRPAVVAGDNDNLSEAMLLDVRRYRDIPMVRSMAIGGKNKLVRSQASIVRGERGMLYLPEIKYGDPIQALLDYGMPVQGGPQAYAWVDTLCDQLTTFTGADGEPDDVADAVSILGRLADEFVPMDDATDTEPVLGAGGYDGGMFPGGMNDTGGGW